MNFTELIRRAFYMTLRNKHLWLLGFLAALAQGGSGFSFRTGNIAPGNFKFPGTTPAAPGSPIPDVLPSMPGLDAMLQKLQDNGALLLAIIAAVIVALLVLGLVFTLLSEIGRGGLIHNVDQLDTGNPLLLLAQNTAGSAVDARFTTVDTHGNLMAADARSDAGVGLPVSFGTGWRAGGARLRTLFGQHLLLQIPLYLLGLLALLIFAASFIPIIRSIAASGETLDSQTVLNQMMGSVFVWVCVLLPLACVTVLYSAAATLLGTFGRRAIMLEGAGAISGIKRAWALLRANLVDSAIVLIITLVSSAIVGLLLGLVALALFVPGMVAFVSATVNNTTLNAAALAALALGGLAVLVLSVIANSIISAWRSALWTLAYRNFMRAPARPAAATPMPAITNSTTQPPL